MSSHFHRDASCCGVLYYILQLVHLIIRLNFTIYPRRLLRVYPLKFFQKLQINIIEYCYCWKSNSKLKDSACNFLIQLAEYTVPRIFIFIFICLNVSFPGWNNKYIFNFHTCVYRKDVATSLYMSDFAQKTHPAHRYRHTYTVGKIHLQHPRTDISFWNCWFCFVSKQNKCQDYTYNNKIHAVCFYGKCVALSYNSKIDRYD